MSSWEIARRDLEHHATPPSQRSAPPSSIATTPLPFVTTNPGFAPPGLAPTAGFSSNPKPPAFRPSQLIGLTPFGAFCHQCKLPVCSSRGQLCTHLSKHCGLFCNGCSVEDFTQFDVREAEKLKNDKNLSVGVPDGTNRSPLSLAKDAANASFGRTVLFLRAQTSHVRLRTGWNSVSKRCCSARPPLFECCDGAPALSRSQSLCNAFSPVLRCKASPVFVQMQR